MRFPKRPEAGRINVKQRCKAITGVLVGKLLSLSLIVPSHVYGIFSSLGKTRSRAVAITVSAPARVYALRADALHAHKVHCGREQLAVALN